jgi:Ca-activated chloride channel family protein
MAMKKRASGLLLLAAIVVAAGVVACRSGGEARSGEKDVAATGRREPTPAGTPQAQASSVPAGPAQPVNAASGAQTTTPPTTVAPHAHRDEAKYVAALETPESLSAVGYLGDRGVAPTASAARVAGGVVGGVVGGLPALSRRPNLQAFEPVDRTSAPFHTESYDRIQDNPFLAAAQNPLSTFSIDVDTAAYANVRRFLAQGQRPPKDAVRIEELLNYFRYDYPEPQGQDPFSVTTELAACPWRPEHRLVLVGLRGRSIHEASVPPRRLTFLIDVSGSMMPPNKLPLLKEAMALLVENLREQDQVAIVVYAGSSGLVLPPTSGAEQAKVRAALGGLEAGGSTAGGAGIELAYRIASQMYEPGAINRVLLATDGDFNVGVTSIGELSRLIEEKRKTGVFLSVLGFGDGNLKDATMEMLADRGNGNYSYIDSEAEARKVLVSEAGATLVTIAKDVKIQVEWNPAQVAGYRLIGYENRLLRAEDFDDDAKDAGEIGAGHTVTALYEVVPAGLPLDRPGVPLKYQAPALSSAAGSGEVMTVKLRYKQPEGDTSRLLSRAVLAREAGRGSERLRFAAAVAAFGMLLRESEHRGRADWAMVRELASEARGRDEGGYRGEFLALVESASALAGAQKVTGQLTR